MRLRRSDTTERIWSKMDIAIIANDKKKELIAEFCIAYCGVLSRHNLCATATTGKYISDSTGLEIERLLSGSHGGEQQIASRIAYDEVDILILFRDRPRPKTIWRASATSFACAICTTSRSRPTSPRRRR